MGIAQAEAAAEYLDLEKKHISVTVTFPELSYGMKSNDNVKVMQALLKGFGFNVGITGNFGKGTKAAVESFQETNSLPVTGKCDHNTWNALLLVK
jgi:peptidoglycan hydrolase-like protein with peptidoglycan-binding domain